ncbi:hypothetical protein [Burkholderia ubonensis]|nr:hypothetical protein [Burkholderia ubonensis]KVP48408.1 hypothetical protein WJ90_14995 [Burkholderia ubonensis]
MSANFDARKEAIDLVKEAVKAGAFAPLQNWNGRAEGHGQQLAHAIGAAVQLLKQKLENL